MDDELAEFTDKVLSGESVGEADVEELRSLQAVVSRLKSTMPNPAAPDTMQRIEKKMIAEWQSSLRSQNAGATFWQKIFQAVKSLISQPRNAFALTFVIIILLLVVLSPINQIVATSFDATAGAADQNQWFLFIGAVILVIGLIWFGRRKS